MLGMCGTGSTQARQSWHMRHRCSMKPIPIKQDDKSVLIVVNRPRGSFDVLERKWRKYPVTDDYFHNYDEELKERGQ